MGRIKFIVVRTALYTHGYTVSLSVFGGDGVIHREEYDRLSWREAMDVQAAVADHFRPGLELMLGGVQESLF